MRAKIGHPFFTSRNNRNPEQNHKRTIWIFVLVSCQISPLLTFAILGIVSGSLPKKSAKILLNPIIFSAAYLLAIVNSTLVPQSDLIYYIDLYELSRNLKFSDMEAMFSSNDPLYLSYNILVAKLLNISASGFIFLTSFILYCLLLGSIGNLGHSRKIDPHLTISVIIFVSFFPQLFSISAFLIRQMLAGAIVAFAFSRLITTGKFSLVLISLAALTHTSAALFFLFPIVHFSFAKTKFHGFLEKLLAIITLSILARLFAMLALSLSLFSNFGLLQYGAIRLTQEQYYNLDALSFSAMAFTVGVGMLAVLGPPKKKKIYSDIDETNTNTVRSAVAFLCLLVIFFYYLGITELPIRILVYIYCLFGIISLEFLGRVVKYSRYILTVSIVVFPFTFLYAIENSKWEYKNPIEAIIFPAGLFKSQ